MLKIFGTDGVEIKVGDTVKGIAHGHNRNPNAFDFSGIVKSIDQYAGVHISNGNEITYQICEHKHGRNVLGGETSNYTWGFVKVQ